MTTTFSQHKYELCIDLHGLYSILEWFLVNTVRWK